MSSCSQCKILQQITLVLGLFTEQYSETSCGVVFFLNYMILVNQNMSEFGIN